MLQSLKASKLNQMAGSAVRNGVRPVSNIGFKPSGQTLISSNQERQKLTRTPNHMEAEAKGKRVYGDDEDSELERGARTQHTQRKAS